MAAHVGKQRVELTDKEEELGSDEECEISDDDGMDAESDSSDEESIPDDFDALDESDAGSDEDQEKETEENGGGDEKEKNPVYGNFGWADAMSKVLNVSKPKNRKSVILAKAKKDVDVLKAKAVKEAPLSFQIAGEIKAEPEPKKEAVKEETLAEKMLRRQKRKEWDLIGRRKPDIVADRERERTLSRIATRGVVQLFNSVKIQQKTIHEKIKAAGPLERKKEKVLKSFDKSEFLNLLTNNIAKSEVKKEPVKIKEEKASWSVLRDDFIPEVTMRDWNKQESSDSDEET